MTQYYYCYLLDNQGQIRARETLEGTEDSEVVEKARRYLLQHPAIPAVEIWLGSKRIDNIRQATERP